MGVCYLPLLRPGEEGKGALLFYFQTHGDPFRSQKILPGNKMAEPLSPTPQFSLSFSGVEIQYGRSGACFHSLVAKKTTMATSPTKYATPHNVITSRCTYTSVSVSRQ